MSDNIDSRETEMLNTTQAAEELGISVPTFRRLLASGAIPKPPVSDLLKRPRRLMFRRADVEALKQSRPAPPAQAAPQRTGENDG